MSYADWTYYSTVYGGDALEEEISQKLEAASDSIDVLTFSRINAVGWEKLTDFQQAYIQKACCVQADFLLDNADAVESAMESYAINGVSMRFGNDALYTIVEGVAMSNRALGLIKQTGLASLFIYPPEVSRALA